MHVLVIGGGLIGVTTAYSLRQRGHDVTLVERRQHLAAEASHANGGMLHASHTEPWNTPQAVGQLLRWIGREDSPLILRPGQLPNLFGWGLNFLRYSRRPHHLRNTRVNARLAVHSLTTMRELKKSTGIRYDDGDAGILKVFHSEPEIDTALQASKLVEDLGVRYQRLDTAEVIRREPALADVRNDIAGGIYYPDDAMGDACLFTQRLGGIAEQDGVEFVMDTAVTRLRPGPHGIDAVETDGGELHADAFVLASGAEAGRLARPVGVHLPIRPVKGYSATVDIGGKPGAPALPFIDEARKVVVSVLGGRLRVAGTVEFAGFDASVRERQARAVLNQGLANLPQLAEALQDSPMTPWACLRPMTVDGPPILGRSPLRNLYLNVGAGHLGWTLAAGAGDVVADVVSSRTPAIDLDGLIYQRY